jgi:hypothetical protein
MPRWYTFAIAICFVLLVSLVANAQGKQDKCLSQTMFVQQIRAAAPELQIVHFVGSRASAMIARYAALPPVNQIDADEMIVVLVPQTSQARSVFFREGCAIGAGVVRLDVMRKIMREALGDDV